MNQVFLEKIKKTLGEDKYDAYLHSLDEKETHGISVNLKKFSKSSITLDFLIDKFEAKMIYKNNNFAYMTYDKEKLEKKGIFPGKDPLYHAGLYYIQEPSAAKVLFDVEFNPSDSVIDLCASPGGKTCMALYNLDKNQGGFLLSNELKIDRAKVLSSNIERMGFDNTIVTSNTTKELSEVLPNFFDKVIVDAPCSGEGMFRKSIEAVNQWNENLVKSCSKTQKEILEDAYILAKEGGLIIYSTCTFSKEEDEENIDYILKSHKDLSLLHSEKVYPFEYEGEGQFFAYIKKGSSELSYKIDMPSEKNLKGLKVLRYMISETEDKNGIKVPTHAITHIDNQALLKERIDLNDNDIKTYLHGETLRMDTKLKGYVLITYKNLGVGLAKVSDGLVKNHYPKGLRLLY